MAARRRGSVMLVERPDAGLDDALVRLVGLPFAALARTRVLAGVCVVLTAWLGARRDPPDAARHPCLRLLPDAVGGGPRNHLYTERYLK